jgi:transcriptional regulator with XRE-family HTH domain
MENSLKNSLATNLKSFRLRAGLSQSDLAKKAATLQPRLAVMESTKNPTLPRLDWLVRVANSLGVTVSELLSEKVVSKPQPLSSLPENEDNLVAHLKELGASFTGPSTKTRPFSPEAVVLGVLRVVASSRMVECLPGLLYNNMDMDYKKLLKLARQRGLVNRLGFVVDVACSMAKNAGSTEKESRLHWLSRKLWDRRNKNAEDYLMKQTPDDPEFRKWVMKRTLNSGKKWGVYGAYSLKRFRDAVGRAT